MPVISEITEKLLRAKAAKGLTFGELANVVECSPIFLAAVCYRQASATAVQAVKLLDALEMDHVHVAELTSFPTKGGLMTDVPVDPLLYRFHEILQVYGLPLKDVIQEMFGDGIIERHRFHHGCREGPRPEGRSREDHHVG